MQAARPEPVPSMREAEFTEPLVLDQRQPGLSKSMLDEQAAQTAHGYG